MKAVECPALGPPEVLRLVELPDPEAGPGQVVIDVHAAGVNFPDALVVAGTYQRKRTPPFVPGSEVAGVVRAAGPAAGFGAGQRVTAFCGIGGYAEQVAVDARLVHPVPDGVDFAAAAVFPVAYGTAYHALVDRARLRAGETLLVLGASGGTGLAAVGLGHALGARVVAAASSAEKLELCRAHGASALIDYRADDLGARLDELAGGPDVVFDPVGGPAAGAAVRRLAWGGRFLTVGYASGDIPRVGMNRLLLKEADLMGVLWGEWAVRHPEQNAGNIAALFHLHGEGRLRPHIDASRTLAQAPEALDAVTGRTATGKIVLRTREDA